jgi:hypothetical protein
MQFGSKILDQFIEQQASYQEEEDAFEKTQMKSNAFERWMAYLLIRGSDQSKYGSLLKGFVSQFSLGNDQYPRTITTATDVLSNHRFDSTYHENQKRNRDKKQENRDQQEQSNETSFAQKKITCYCCGKDGHTVPNCPDKDNTPHNQLALKRAMQHMQNENKGNGKDSKTIITDNNNDESVSFTTNTSSRNSRRGSRRRSSSRNDH